MKFFSYLLFSLVVPLGLTASAVQAQSTAEEAATAPQERAPYTETIPGTLIEFKMMPVPGGTVTIETPDGPKQVEVEPYWIGQTEVTWDAYDLFVYGRNETTSAEVDAISRPSKPYVLPGEAFGHHGHPALAMTREAAQNYARWLSAVTGKTYRLPTKAEWTQACHLNKPESGGENALGEHTWYKENADGQTHEVGSLEPGRLGLYDMLGNVAEWVVETDTAMVKGGSFQDPAAEVGCGVRQVQIPAWKATDPQIPKSQSWLSDAPFVGFRVVRPAQ